MGISRLDKHVLVEDRFWRFGREQHEMLVLGTVEVDDKSSCGGSGGALDWSYFWRLPRDISKS